MPFLPLDKIICAVCGTEYTKQYLSCPKCVAKNIEKLNRLEKKEIKEKKMSKTIKELVYDVIEGVMCESYKYDYIVEISERVCKTIEEWINRKVLVADVKVHMGAEPLTINKLLEELKK